MEEFKKKLEDEKEYIEIFSVYTTPEIIDKYPRGVGVFETFKFLLGLVEDKQQLVDMYEGYLKEVDNWLDSKIRTNNELILTHPLCKTSEEQKTYLRRQNDCCRNIGQRIFKYCVVDYSTIEGVEQR